MEIVSKVMRMREVVAEMRRQGRTVSLVPTMGALHEGHLALVRLARERGTEVVVSIFVNEPQFDDEGDFRAYPRDLTRDAELLVKEGVRYVFAPSSDEMYPKGHCTQVEVTGAVARKLLGAARPGHFRGVTTVVTKLLNIVEPDLAVFGWKDAQQLAVIRRLVVDLNVDVEIVGGPTIRESDGLACSSRNALLDEPARRSALALYRSLKAAQKTISEGERSPEAVVETVRRVLEEEERLEIEHAEVLSAKSLARMKRLKGEVLVSISVLVPTSEHGDVRLIDNLRVKIKKEDE